MAVIVDTINGMFRRGRCSHVGEKVFKLMPSLAYGNPASPIKFINWDVRSFASIKHIAPDTINSCTGFVVGSVQGCSVLALKTATRICSAIAQISGANTGGFAA